MKKPRLVTLISAACILACSAAAYSQSPILQGGVRFEDRQRQEPQLQGSSFDRGSIPALQGQVSQSALRVDVQPNFSGVDPAFQLHTQLIQGQARNTGVPLCVSYAQRRYNYVHYVYRLYYFNERVILGYGSDGKLRDVQFMDNSRFPFTATGYQYPQGNYLTTLRYTDFNNLSTLAVGRNDQGSRLSPTDCFNGQCWRRRGGGVAAHITGTIQCFLPGQ